jgi:hypothetical protein
MGEPNLLSRIRYKVGQLSWKIFIWAHYGGKEEVYHNYRDEEAFNTYSIELPKELSDKIYINI